MHTLVITRAGDIDPNPVNLATRTRAALASLGKNGSVTIVVSKSEKGLQSFVIAPDHTNNTAFGSTLAQSIGGKATVVDGHEISETLDAVESIGYAKSLGTMFGRETTVAVDVKEFARTLGGSLPDGSWIAATLRPFTGREQRYQRDWVAHQLGAPSPTHHSVSTNALVVSLYAGAGSPDMVEHALQTALSAMPGFDISFEPRIASTRRFALYGLLMAAIAGVLAFAPRLIPTTALSAETNKTVNLITTLSTPFFVAVGVIALVIGLLRARGIISSFDNQLLRAPLTLNFPAPPKRFGSPRKPRAQRFDARNQRMVEAQPGDYPLDDRAFMIGSHVVVPMIAPQSGAASGATVTSERAVPPAVTRKIGPLISRSGGGVHFDAGSMLFGILLNGQPSSGKSVLMRGLVGWNMAEKALGATVPRSPGRNNTIIAFESKEFKGVEWYRRWAQATGDRLIESDTMNPASYAIDIVNVPGFTASQRAAFLTDAFKYAFGEEAVGNQSSATLVSMLTVALLLDADLLSGAEENGVPANKSPFFYVNVLLGGYGGDDRSVALHKHLSARHQQMNDSDPRKAEFGQALNELAHIFSRTTAARTTFLQAPLNKMQQIIQLESYWSPSRPKLTWDKIVNDHMTVVVNLGQPETREAMLSETQKGQLAALLMFALQNTIQRVCDGWEEQRRYVSLFSDELSLLAPFSPDVFQFIRDQGRAFGVRPHFATQRVEQLADRVRSVVLTFVNLVTFRQDMPEVAETLVKQLAFNDPTWTANDILDLDKYQAAMRLQAEDRRQPPFLCYVDNLESDIAGTLRGWGHNPSMVAPAPVFNTDATAVSTPAPVDAPTIPMPPDDGPDVDVDAYFGGLDDKNFWE